MDEMNQEDVWDEIAIPWEEYRVDPMQEAVDFLKDKQGKILDLGCGSGRNFARVDGVIYAIDFSEKMLKLAEKKADRMCIDVEFTQSDTKKIPFEDNFFHSAIFIAALHCVETAKDREKTLRELFRVLKPGAEAMITVWSRNQNRIKNKPKETKIPWSKDGRTYLRYCYIYDKEELEQLVKKIGFGIINSKEDRNIVLVIKKP